MVWYKERQWEGYVRDEVRSGLGREAGGEVRERGKEDTKQCEVKEMRHEGCEGNTSK